MKKCSRCGRVMPEECFSSDRTKKSGLSIACKDCNAERCRRYYDRKYRGVKDSGLIKRGWTKGKSKREARDSINAACKRRWGNQSKRVKGKAKFKLHQSIVSGEVEKGTFCLVCGSRKEVQAHHEDYNRPLDVIWLCRQCHAFFHNEKRSEERMGEYAHYRTPPNRST